jgi:tetratricopeptide (TPR) repeat protein
MMLNLEAAFSSFLYSATHTSNGKKQSSPKYEKGCAQVLAYVSLASVELGRSSKTLLTLLKDATRKTQIALEYAFRLHSEDPTLNIIWINAHSSSELVDDFRKLAISLGLGLDDDPDEAPSVLGAILGWLGGEGRKWLLILDDADEDNLDETIHCMIRGLMKDISSSSGSYKAIMVTTRRKLSYQRLYQVREIVISSPSTEEAKEILRSCLEGNFMEDDFDAHAETVVKTLECLPLAISMAAKFIQSRSITLDEYLRLFHQQSQRLLKNNPFQPSLGLVFDLLRQDHPDVVNFLLVLAMFDTTEVPVSLLQAPEAVENADVRIEVSELVNVSLLRPNLEERSYQMHQVVKDAVNQYVVASGQEKARVTEAVALIAARSMHLEEISDAWKTLIPLIPAITQRPCETSADKFRGILLFKLATYEAALGKTDEAYQNVSKACSILENSELPEDDPTMIKIKAFLAGMCVAQRRYPQAAAVYEATLEQSRLAFGADHPLTVHVSTGLARVYYRQGQMAQSEQLLSSTLDTCSRSFGVQHPLTLSVMSFLATLLSKEGNYEAAERLSLKTMEGYNALMGPTHPDTLACMNTLVSILTEQGRLVEGRKLAEEAFHLSRKVLGEEHPDTLACMNNLALILGESANRSGDISLFDEAEALNLRCLQLYRKVMGRNHPAGLTSLLNLGRIDFLQDRLRESEAIIREALSISETILGPEHPTTTDSRLSLARVLEKQGQWTEACDLYKTASQVLSHFLGPGHPTTAECLKSYESAQRMIQSAQQQTDANSSGDSSKVPES